MNLLKNIKKNYYNNLFDDYLKTGNYKQLIIDLKNLSKKHKKLFSTIAPKYVSASYNHFSEDDLLNKNLVWLNTFYKKDITVIKNFLEFYLPSSFNNDFEFIDLSEEFINFFKEISDTNKKITFDNMLDFNELIQFLISQKNNKYKFIINNGAFFEIVEANKYFSYTNICCAYIYMIRNPLNIFQDLCDQNISKDEALNYILHLDGRNQFYKSGEYQIEESTQSWEINVNSWTNENVMNTFNGLLIKYESLFDDTMQIFAELIAHLNMSGLNIELDYEKIQEFISDQKESLFFVPSKNVEISNNTKILLSRQIEDTAKKFQYEF